MSDLSLSPYKKNHMLNKRANYGLNMTPETIETYISKKSELHQTRLQELLTILRESAPNAEESLKWNKPALSYQTILFIFSAHKHHISLHPTPAAVTAFSADLSEYKTSQNTIQFPLNTPIPKALVMKIAQYRVKQVVEHHALWK